MFQQRGIMKAMMFLMQQLHALEKASLAIGCGNASFSNILSHPVPISTRYSSSWKPFSVSCSSRSHTGRIGVVAREQTHDRSVSNVGIFGGGGIRIPKCGNIILRRYSCKSGGIVITEKTVNTNTGRKFIGEKYFVTMSGKGPGLIVFDLDCTLWPHHVDTTVNPPFIQNNSKVVDQDGETITYYPEVPKVLEYLQSEGYPLAAASRTTKPPAAEQLLNFFDWNKFFKYKEIYPGSKVTHFAKFVEKTNIPHSEMLFFDDEQRNIIDMEKEGVKCVLVRNGVNLQLVKDSIEKFKNGTL